MTSREIGDKLKEREPDAIFLHTILQRGPSEGERERREEVRIEEEDGTDVWVPRKGVRGILISIKMKNVTAMA